MNTKLTLTIEQAVIERAKEYAKEKNRSLSYIIENYLKMITQGQKIPQGKKHDSVVESMKGSFKMPADMDYKKELQKIREEKYL